MLQGVRGRLVLLLLVLLCSNYDQRVTMGQTKYVFPVKSVTIQEIVSKVLTGTIQKKKE